jgi:Fe-Mn family superoxide dismutase
MAFTLPDLPFDPAHLPAFCSKETFEYHHGKHHATYVTKLNDAIENTDYQNLSLEEIIKKSYQDNHKPVYNNAAQHFNHSFFWNSMSPNGGGEPGEQLKTLINRDFGSIDKFKEIFTNTAAALFGSGWAWLALDENGKLEILAMKDADTPIIQDKTPLLTLDVWEHAYYIDHRNARPKYSSAFWNYINWAFAEAQIS